jgi:glycosyltransferase involved in cell wall biosynthesis
MVPQHRGERRSPPDDFHTLRLEIDRLRLDLHALAMRLDDSVQTNWLRCAWYRLGDFYGGARHKVRKLLRPNWDQPQVPWRAPYEVRTKFPPQPQRPRVLHFIGNFYMGGSARLVVDLIEGLGHLFEQRVIARDLPSEPAYVGLDLQQVKRFTSARHAWHCIERFSPHVMHIHYLGHRNNDYSLRDWQWYRHVFDALEHFDCPVIENVNIPVVPFFSPRVNCYVHVSRFVETKFGFLCGDNHVIYPGSDFSLFARNQGEALPDDCVGMVYRLEGDKLNRDSIEVFIEVVRRRPRTRVLIVGGGTLLEPFRSRVREAGLCDAFTFAGYVPYEQLPPYLAQMSLFVAPVHKESFGQVGPFAMGMQIPVVGYNVGALEEITGTPALLAPAGDLEALVRIIIHLLENRQERLRIGEAHRRRAEALFSVESMVASYQELYSQLAPQQTTASSPTALSP